MVRVNLISPKALADQHLIAEYDEILMLASYARRYPSLRGIPKNYCLGKGHIKFFKNRILYLRKRHDALKKEMKKRGFKARKTISLRGFKSNQLNGFRPSKRDFAIIKKRLIWKICKKPGYYRHHGEHKPKKFLIDMIKKA